MSHVLVSVAALVAATLATGSPAEAAKKHAAFILDVNTGKTLYASSADAPRFPASLTKMMTLYIVFDMIKEKRLSLDARLLISPRAAATQPSKLGVPAGRTIKIRDAIKALVTKSANDVAVAIAENLAGTEQKFARYMTWKARQLGMRKTTFRNASGLPDAYQKTTARDMARLGLRLAEDHPKFFRNFRIKRFTYAGKRYRNHNKLLANFKGTDGIKTGYTRASGFNLVTSVRRGKRHVIAVVMGGKTAGRRDAKMRKLLTRYLPKASTRRTRARVPQPELIAQKARKPASRRVAAIPKPRAASRAAGLGATGLAPAGRYVVQVGSHGDQASAKRHLTSVRTASGGILARANPITAVFRKDARTWYRARFIGFTRDAARSACTRLKQKQIDCIVMRR